MEYHQTALKVSFITLPLLHWTDLKTTLEKSPKLWNIPAEQTSSLLPHFHSRREDLSSIVTWVLRDFGSLHTLPEKHTHSVVCTVPWFSVASLRVLISKQGANTNAPPQILLFTFGLQPHKKLSYQTCKTKIINSTKQHSFSRGQIHYKVVTFVCKFKNLHSTLTYRDPPPPFDWLWEDELKRKVLKVEYHFCSSLTGKHEPARQTTSWTSKITCVFMWTLSYHVWSTIFNSTGGRKAVFSSDVYLLTPKMENITTRGD